MSLNYLISDHFWGFFFFLYLLPPLIIFFHLLSFSFITFFYSTMNCPLSLHLLKYHKQHSQTPLVSHKSKFTIGNIKYNWKTSDSNSNLNNNPWIIENLREGEREKGSGEERKKGKKDGERWMVEKRRIKRKRMMKKWWKKGGVWKVVDGR